MVVVVVGAGEGKMCAAASDVISGYCLCVLLGEEPMDGTRPLIYPVENAIGKTLQICKAWVAAEKSSNEIFPCETVSCCKLLSGFGKARALGGDDGLGGGFRR